MTDDISGSNKVLVFLFLRMKYDAYRSRVDSLRMAQSTSRDVSLHVRLRDAEVAFELHKQKYDRIHNDLIIKLKFLEENKVLTY
jgi:arfaptin